jgi:hypothetical protein
MKTSIEAAIQKLMDKATESHAKAGEAMQFTQAALNLAHALATLDNIR